ncbi:MAG: hypothetical protein LBT21_03985 [Oscillospiraceae bacterium]|jgi:hypothetical protein|nr:hypothetical protein [Oscillospiraceae bacterium]
MELADMVQNLVYSIFDKFQALTDGNGTFSQLLAQVREWLEGFLPAQVAS